MKYNPALDGVRAVSAIAVVMFHSAGGFASGGAIGVDVFFVLSGYLITSILRSELKITGSIRLKRFYARRAARLMPPLVLAMVGTYTAYALLFPQVNIKADILSALFYVSDYGVALWGTPTLIIHTWSLSVEEHFYLLWPLFLIATRKFDDRELFRLLVAMFVLATAWRFADGLLWNDWTRTYYRFDTRLSGLILGAVLAVRQWRVDKETSVAFGKYSLLALALLVQILPRKDMSSLLFGGLVADLMTALLIVALTSEHRTPVSKALEHPWLVYIGVLSYSIYLWHYGIALVFRDHLNPFSAFILTFGAAFALAAISHKAVEAPLKKWGNGLAAAS